MRCSILNCFRLFDLFLLAIIHILLINWQEKLTWNQLTRRLAYLFYISYSICIRIEKFGWTVHSFHPNMLYNGLIEIKEYYYTKGKHGNFNNQGHKLLIKEYIPSVFSPNIWLIYYPLCICLFEFLSQDLPSWNKIYDLKIRDEDAVGSVFGLPDPRSFFHRIRI